MNLSVIVCSHEGFIETLLLRQRGFLMAEIQGIISMTHFQFRQNSRTVYLQKNIKPKYHAQPTRNTRFNPIAFAFRNAPYHRAFFVRTRKHRNDYQRI